MAAGAVRAEEALMRVPGGMTGLAVEPRGMVHATLGALLEYGMIHADRPNVSPLMFDLAAGAFRDVNVEGGLRLHQQFRRRRVAGNTGLGLVPRSSDLRAG